ncbi:hypothetical protein VN1220_00910 [Helicobacter pylori]
MSSIKDIIQVYNSVVKNIDKDAQGQDSRAYGGVIRSAKGKLQEYISEEIVKIAWQNIGAKTNRLEINSKKNKHSYQRQLHRKYSQQASKGIYIRA